MTLPPVNKKELMQRANAIAGLTLADLSENLKIDLPDDLLRAKGLIGQILEQALGATAGVKSEPDFQKLGIELKTIPINNQGKPLETTYVCTVPLINVSGLVWKESCVYKKLASVLWIPIEADADIAISKRRIGSPILYEMSDQLAHQVRLDWEEHMEKIAIGQVETINGHYGVYLQIRPKAAHSRVTTKAIGPEGDIIDTLPRGFYLRTQFTEQILKAHLLC